jgi:hypothetical protein
MKMQTVFEFGGANPFKAAKTKSLITLQQYESKPFLFKCTYGLEVKDKLTYGEACAKLGQAILHHLACEGLVNNEE